MVNGLPCSLSIAIVGLLASVAIVGQIVQVYGIWLTYYESSNWERVPIKVVSVEVKEIRSTGKNSSTSYILRCNYTYTIDGKSYTGKRIGAEDKIGADRKETFRRYEILKRCKEGTEEHLAYVSPFDREVSILFRSVGLSYFLFPLMLSVFLVFSLLAFVVGTWLISQALIRRKLLQQHPDEPWLAEPEWNTFHQKAGSISRLIIIWAFTFLLAATMTPFVFFFLFNFSQNPIVALFGLSFFSFPLGIAKLAIKTTIDYKKYGIPKMHFPKLPIKPGEKFEGTITLLHAIRPDDGVVLSLRCTDPEGAQQGICKEMLWMENQRIYEDKEIQFSFIIPEKLPPRDALNRCVTYTLELAALVKGVEVSFTFNDLPVYKSTQKSS